MEIDGTWDISIKATVLPVSLKGTLEFRTDGDALSGTSTTSFGTSDFTGGKVDGNRVEFSVESSTPFGPATLDIQSEIDGDKLSGEATMQPNGMKAKITGTRVK